MDDFADIAKRMKELQLERDKPFDQPLQPDFHAELNAKLLAKKTDAEILADVKTGQIWLANPKWEHSKGDPTPRKDHYNHQKIIPLPSEDSPFWALPDKTAQANAKWRELREKYNQPKIVTVTPTVCKDGLGRSEQYKYNQAELEKLHGY